MGGWYHDKIRQGRGSATGNKMDYQGQRYPIQLGKGGLYTDAPHTRTPPINLVRADNVSLFNGLLEKDFGSRRWNASALPAGIKDFKDFWTDPVTQTVLVLLKNGQVYSCPNSYTQTLVTANSATDTTLNTSGNTSIVLGGNELAGNPRKAFIVDGYHLPQVVKGNASTRYEISKPAADWTTNNQPFAGLVFRGRLALFGNQNNPHTLYVSTGSDHEDFQTGPLLFFNIYPGEGERIIAAAIFRGTLYVFKYPLGVYYLVDSDPSSSNWYFAKFADSFGASSPHALCSVFDDLLVGNNYGSITSLKAALVFGNLYLADLFHELKMKRYADNNIKKGSDPSRYLVYYPEKYLVMTSFQSNQNYVQDRILNLDYHNALVPNTTYQIAQLPAGMWNTKDQPNCLATVKDAAKVERPFYGANDGYLYQMDQADRWVGGASSNKTGYQMVAQTPAYNFQELSPQIAELNKNYEFLELEYEPTGDWNLNCDVIIDGRFAQTVKFNLSGNSTLGQMRLSAGAIVGGSYTTSTMVPIAGCGRRIQFKLYDDGISGQSVKAVSLGVYFNLAGTEQTTK